jgi:hypothetical protein
MSHRFKASTPITAQGRQMAEIRRLARSIPDQTTLEAVLARSRPAMRAGVFELLRPHLRFVPEVNESE